MRSFWVPVVAIILMAPTALSAQDDSAPCDAAKVAASADNAIERYRSARERATDVASALDEVRNLHSGLSLISGMCMEIMTDSAELLLYTWEEDQRLKVAAQAANDIDAYDLDVLVFHGRRSSIEFCNTNPIWADDPPLELGCELARGLAPAQVTQINAQIAAGSSSEGWRCEKARSDAEGDLYACSRR